MLDIDPVSLHSEPTNDFLIAFGNDLEVYLGFLLLHAENWGYDRSNPYSLNRSTVRRDHQNNSGIFSNSVKHRPFDIQPEIDNVETHPHLSRDVYRRPF